MRSAQVTGIAPRSSSPTTRILTLALVTWIAVLIVRSAWLSDDAYITFRSVDNFVSGRGMTWNAGQRVQAFTHPVWFFVVSAAYAVTHEIYYTVIGISVAVAVAGLWLAVQRVAVSDWSALPVLIGLGCSRAFIDFSTSGLENVLSHSLLFAWLACLVTPKLRTQRPWFDLITGLLLLNRLDLALLLSPTWLWVMWQRQRGGVGWRRLSWHLGWTAAPLLLWFSFSLFYFGFALPNTAYAKLGIRTPLGERFEQGSFYLLTLLSTDPETALLLLIGIATAVRRSGWLRPLAFGMLLYLVYIGYIGGDFMQGRFCSVLAVAASAMLLRTYIERSAALVLALVLAMTGLAGPTPPLFSGVEAEGRPGAKVELRRNRVMDERRFYYRETGLLTADRLREMPSGRYRSNGLRLKGVRGKVVGQIGMRAFIAGPSAVLIDPFALTDPFLARIPAVYKGSNSGWVAGHWKRALPEGYRETVISGRNQLTDPKLAPLYEEMQLITTGALWSWARLGAIWRLNTGQLPRLTPRPLEWTADDDDAS